MLSCDSVRFSKFYLSFFFLSVNGYETNHSMTAPLDISMSRDEVSRNTEILGNKMFSSRPVITC